MKIKLTREQIIKKLDERVREFGIIGDIELYYPHQIPKEMEFDIDESQIIREKSNVEKWVDVMQKWDDEGFYNKLHIATRLDQLGLNADAAYKEVCGGE